MGGSEFNSSYTWLTLDLPLDLPPSSVYKVTYSLNPTKGQTLSKPLKDCKKHSCDQFTMLFSKAAGGQRQNVKEHHPVSIIDVPMTFLAAWQKQRQSSSTVEVGKWRPIDVSLT